MSLEDGVKICAKLSAKIYESIKQNIGQMFPNITVRIDFRVITRKLANNSSHLKPCLRYVGKDQNFLRREVPSRDGKVDFLNN